MAAKLIQVSDDGGSNFLTLPGGTGSFNNESEQINDTVFGQTFQSNETGLIGWSVEAQAFYKGFAGYITTVKKQNTSTGMTTEAMTLVSGKIFQIDDATKEIWDRNGGTFTIFDNAVDKTADVEFIDYLFGTITFFDAFSVVEPVTVTGFFFTTTTLGTANAFTVTQTADPIESTDFATAQANSGLRTFDPGLRTVQVELTGFYTLANAFLADLKARSEVVIEINPDGVAATGSLMRGFFLIASEAQSGDVGALEEETTLFTLQVPTDPADVAPAGGYPQPPQIPFGWQHETGTGAIDPAIKIVLEAWDNETKIDVQYLSDGVAGIKGKAVVTDVSLTGGLSVMNEYSITMMGDGAQTVV